MARNYDDPVIVSHDCIAREDRHPSAGYWTLNIHWPVDIQRPVACGGVSVFPGDAIVGDDDGVIVIPRHLASEVGQRAIEQERRERFILNLVRDGASIIGTYPPDASTLAAFEASRSKHT